MLCYPTTTVLCSGQRLALANALILKLSWPGYPAGTSHMQMNQHNSVRLEDDLWKAFSRELKNRNLEIRMEQKTFTTSDDEVTFQKSVKNGIWHCVQPVSFDLMHSSSIKEKAHKWLGQISSVSEQADQFMLYFLVAEPSRPELMDSYENAKTILEKVPSENVIFTEEESGALVEQLGAVVRQ